MESENYYAPCTFTHVAILDAVAEYSTGDTVIAWVEAADEGKHEIADHEGDNGKRHPAQGLLEETTSSSLNIRHFM